VCCNARCDDPCAACDIPGKLGVCSPVSGATHGARAACGGQGACGARCDGVSTASCAFASVSVSCGASYCNSGLHADSAACDGNGACAPGSATACASFNCQGGACSNTCSASSDCVGAAACVGGKCQAEQPALPPPVDVSNKGSCGCRVAGGGQGRREASLLGLIGLVGLARARTRRRRKSARNAA
jgi:MYXO-CTERM domain-containing protein